MLPEDRFIPPSQECPHPQWWSSADGDSTEWEVSEMIGGFVRGLQPNYCIETGAAFGQTTATIAEALERNGHGHLDALEIDLERAEQARLRVADLSRAEVWCIDSLAFSPTGIVDFVFFDSHYEYRVPEFVRFRPAMRLGTVVVFHDTAPEHGAHRIPSGNDLRTEIRQTLGDVLDVVNLPTPRGVTIGVVR